MPTGNPMISEKMIAIRPSWREMGSRKRISSVTECLVQSDCPRSPWIASPRKRKYWMYTGASSPSCTRSVCASSATASSPVLTNDVVVLPRDMYCCIMATIRSITSPGIHRIMKNAINETMNKVGIISKSRLMM